MGVIYHLPEEAVSRQSGVWDNHVDVAVDNIQTIVHECSEAEFGLERDNLDTLLKEN